ncbi:ADAM 17-like protease [Babylonia areolata]|uniref:ADAM 17-like protease n=1 Tax=Babylonia areolata TaxID=304850 RepID=UPI003FCFC32D
MGLPSFEDLSKTNDHFKQPDLVFSKIMSKFMLIWVVTTCLLVFSQGALEDKLRYYEVLHSHDVLARSRRSLGPHHQRPRQGHELTIRIFNMTLVCHLYPRKNLFTPSFRLVVVDGTGENQVNDFDTEQFLVGTCEDDSLSDVHGYFSDGVFEGRITYNGVVYGIEEAKRHIQEKEIGEHHGKMIAYRSSDIIWEENKNRKGPSFCGASHADDPDLYSRFGMTIETLEESRVKRATVPDNWSTCRVIAVADFKFYRFIGGNNIYSTAAYIGSVMERVDAIYRSTVFDIGYEITGLGFEISEIKINTVPTTGFNADGVPWEPLKLLQMFGRDLYFKDFCLAHLFTHQQFSGNVLGLAYIAAETIGSAGGICSPTRDIENHETALNTGWSTTQNSNGDTVLSEQAQLVTAHG